MGQDDGVTLGGQPPQFSLLARVLHALPHSSAVPATAIF